MRALWSLVVVCLVAATGVRPAGSDSRSQVDAVARHVAARALAAQLQGATGAAGDTIRSTSRAAEPVDPRRPLPPATAAASFALQPPAPRALAHSPFVVTRASIPLVLTCSARGPPIA